MAELLELAQPVIIAMKGLPCTGKSEIGWVIDRWARCPTFYIDYFLDALSLEKGYTAEFLPSPDQAELLHRLSFHALCKVASNSLQWAAEKRYNGYMCVITKSRLCSTFELHHLLQLARECGCGMILIIEFQMKNDYRFRCRLEDNVKAGRQKEWYKPRSWKDIDKAKDDYDANNWDLHLRHLLDNGDDLPPVTRLVVDPFDHLYLSSSTISYFTIEVINFLLSRVEVGNHESDDKEDDLYLKGRYTIVQYTEVGRHLREKDLRRPRSMEDCDNEYLCYSENNAVCTIKYWEELQLDVEVEDSPYYCGVCEETVILAQPAYGCIFCSLTLHKSCAEQSDNNVTLEGYKDIEFLRLYPKQGLKGHACKSCLKGGWEFSCECRSCNFQTHLKCGKLPTILNHDCHDHFLNIYFSETHKCKACGVDRNNFVGGGAYGCYICYIYYDIECLSLVREVDHEHGGHQHSLTLVYTRDGIQEEEAYWCDICYEDMDPQTWFYCCQQCPYFEAHPNCVRLSIN